MHRLPLLALAFLLLGLPLAGCAALGTTPRPDGRVLVSAEWLSDHLDDPRVVVLHVAADRAHYDAGHVPGARYLPLSAVAVHRDDRLNVLPPTDETERALRAVGVSDDSHVVLVGDLDGLAAARAFFALDVHGVGQRSGRLSVLDGGLAAWQASGQALATDSTPAPRAGTVRLALRADRVVGADEVEARRHRTGAVLLDARPLAQHTGDEPGDSIARPGHIPDSAHRFWRDDLRADGTLRPTAELAAAYASRGVAPGRELIVYCRTGVQAAHAYLVARALGLAPRLYDASFHEWSNLTTYPVARGR